MIPIRGRKLNKPRLTDKAGFTVKLNNPLMGTETQSEEPIMSY